MKTTISLRTKLTLTIAGLLAITGIFYASPTQFPTVPTIISPVGVASSSSALYVTDSNTQNVYTIDDTGNVSFFAAIPNPASTPPDWDGTSEKYLAISPGFDKWDPEYVYVTQGGQIYKVPPNGSGFEAGASPAPSPFATIPGCGFDHTGITFDQLGTSGFNYDMIVTCNNGGVWRVDPAGSPSPVTNTGTTIEGPVVAPSGFGLYGGQIWVAAENDGGGQVHAIDNQGHVTYGIVSWGGAEALLAIPSNPCSFGDSEGNVFAAIENHDALYKFSFSTNDLSLVGGKILVTSETGEV